MGHVIAVMPASGGVGASTLAAVLAVRAAQAGRAVVAVDLDRFGGRLDIVLGAEQEPGWRWPQLRGVSGVVAGASLAKELPRGGAVPVLAHGSGLAAAGQAGPAIGGRPASAEAGAAGSGPPGPEPPGRRLDGPGLVGDRAREAWVATLPDVVAGLRTDHSVTVLDVGRDASVVSAVAPLVDAWVVLVGTGVPQLASAAASIPLLRAVVDDACAGPAGAGVLRRPCEPWAVVRGVRIEDEVVDAVCDHLDIPVVARVPDDLRLVADVTCGVAPGARGRGAAVEAADEVLLRLVSRPPLDAALPSVQREPGAQWPAGREPDRQASGEGEWRWSA